MLDQAAACLQRYTEWLDQNVYVQNLKRQSILKALTAFNNVMNEIRITIAETDKEESQETTTKNEPKLNPTIK